MSEESKEAKKSAFKIKRIKETAYALNKIVECFRTDYNGLKFGQQIKSDDHMFISSNNLTYLNITPENGSGGIVKYAIAVSKGNKVKKLIDRVIGEKGDYDNNGMYRWKTTDFLTVYLIIDVYSSYKKEEHINFRHQIEGAQIMVKNKITGLYKEDRFDSERVYVKKKTRLPTPQEAKFNEFLIPWDEKPDFQMIAVVYFDSGNTAMFDSQYDWNEVVKVIIVEKLE